MTYKLNPEIRKIESPVVLVKPDGQKLKYTSGDLAAEAVFDKQYVVKALRAVDNTIEIELDIPVVTGMNWKGEEAISFF